MHEEPRIIKKYPNRRLYDTAISSYITLNEIKALVKDYVDFKVIDSRTGADLTRSTLLQIIVEEEEVGSPLLTSGLLAKAIRVYGDSTQALLGRFLEHSLDQFVENQGRLKSPVSSLTPGGTGQSLHDMLGESLNSWNPKQQRS